MRTRARVVDDLPRRGVWPDRHGLRRANASVGFVADGDVYCWRDVRRTGPWHDRCSFSRQPAMDDPRFEIISVAQARRVLTNGDIKSDVAFQHDVNRLLASLEDLCDVLDTGPTAGAPRG